MTKTATPTQGGTILQLDDLRAAAQGLDAPLARVAEALKRGDQVGLAALSALPAARTAALVLQLGPSRGRDLLALLPDAPNLAVLHQLDPAVRRRLVDKEGQDRLARLVAGLDVATAADLLAGLPDAVIARAVGAHPEAAEIRAAVTHAEGTAGAAMVRRDLIATPQDWTVAQVSAEIRSRSGDIGRLHAVFMVDADYRLVGYLTLGELLMQPPETRVGDIMHRDVIAVTADQSGEAVARITESAHLPVIPVTDARGRLVGIIGTQEIRHIGEHEIAEDLKQLSSVAPDSDPLDGPVMILRRRFPWLASALIGALGAGLIVGSFEEALEEAVILASLIPMVMDMAGNAGIQASTVTIEAMAGASFWRGDIRGRFYREIGGAVLNGMAVGLVTLVGIQLLSLFVEIEAPFWLGITAAVTLVLITVQAAAVGVLVPLGLKRLNFNPAVGTGVFITTINDFLGITILFLVAKVFYLPHLATAAASLSP